MAPVPLETIRGCLRQLVVRQVLDSLLSDRFGQLVVRQVWDSLLSDSFASLLANGFGQLVRQRFCTGVVGQRFCTALSKMALYRRCWPKVLYSIVG